MDTYSFTPQSATGLLSRLRAFWNYAKLYLFRRQAIPLNAPDSPRPKLERPKEPPGEIPGKTGEIPGKTGEIPTESAQEIPFQGNRAARRQAAAWERERMKRDKFVTPKGELPAKVERTPRPKLTPPDSVPAAPPEPLPQVEEANKVMLDDGVGFPENEIWGEFAFRDTILDQLDRYWVYLARMKRNDPDAYEFYKQIGAIVVPPVHWFLHKGARWEEKDGPVKAKPPKPLSPWWKQNRPGFGCVTYGIYSRVEEDEMAARFEGKDKNKRMWIPKFLYFVKYHHPPANIQPTTGGDVYRMTVWWDRPQDEKAARKNPGGVPEEYAVYVSADGNDVHVLPMHETEYLPIRRKKSSNGYKRGSTFTIPHRCWTIPRYYVNWAKRHGQDANTFLTSLFLDAAHSVEMAGYSMVRVSVHNGPLTASFGVDVKKLPYFFQDRDIVLGATGSRKRAFHLVRPHVRKDGAAVKMHFRGERDFTWAGYSVSITIPARDHFMLTDFDVGADNLDEVPKKDRKLYLTEKKVAAKLVENMKRGLGGTRH